VKVSSVRALLRSTRGDALVLVVTAVATVTFDLVIAVVLGLIVSAVHALRQAAGSARLDREPVSDDSHSEEERRLLDEHVVAYRLDGPLIFAGAHAFLLELTEISDVRIVILRMSRLGALDATGARLLGDTIADLEQRGVTVLLSGTRPDHLAVLDSLGVLNTLAHERHVFDTTPEAIAHARSHLRKHVAPPR
jgi:MFS superfamily sulfate permease-like transporter